MQYQLKIPFEKLIEGLTSLIEKSNELLDYKEIDETVYFSSFKKLKKDTIGLMVNSVTPMPIFLIEKVSYLTTITDPFTRDFTIEKLPFILTSIIAYLEMVDSFRGNEIVEIATTQDKLDYVLTKLNIAPKNLFFSVYNIFELNNYEYSYEEVNEISGILVKKGYALSIDSYSNDEKLRITVKGSLYIERKLTSKQSNNKKSKDPELNKILNDLVEKLDTLGLGQEVIFNEIEELRNLIGVINKKNWTELLKGKIFDLALSQIINKETASMIYEFITNTPLKLLK